MFLGLQIFGLDGSKFLVSGGFKFWYGGVDIFGFGILVWRGPIFWFGVGSQTPTGKWNAFDFPPVFPDSQSCCPGPADGA